MIKEAKVRSAEPIDKAVKQAAVTWATTNKGFSELRNLLVAYIYGFIDHHRYDIHSRLFQIIKRRFAESIVRDTAKHLTKAQQIKLRIALDKIGQIPLDKK